MNNFTLRIVLGAAAVATFIAVIAILYIEREEIFTNSSWDTIGILDRHNRINEPSLSAGAVQISETTPAYDIQVSYPAGLPDEIVRKIQADISEFRAFQDPDFTAQYTLFTSVSTHTHGEYSSYVITTDMYTGGANSNSLVETYVYKDGRRVGTDDLLRSVSDKALLVDVISNKLDEQHAGNWFKDEFSTKSEALENFYITQESLAYAFSEYSVGPGVLGVVRIEIPFSEIPFTLLTEESKTDEGAEVYDFWSCIDVTGLVLESYPRQCVHEGINYTEVITDVSVGDSAPGECVIAGCSSQLCISDKEFAETGGLSTCEYQEEYMCYKKASCEVQPSGACGWTMDEELTQCLSGA